MVDLMRFGEAVSVLGRTTVSNTQTHVLKSGVPAGVFTGECDDNSHNNNLSSLILRQVFQCILEKKTRK